MSKASTLMNGKAFKMQIRSTFSSIPKRVFGICSLALAGIYTITIYAGVSDRDFYVYLLSDRGPVEILAILFTMFAAVLFGAAYFKHKSQRVILFLVFALLVLFVLNGIVLVGLEFYFVGIPLLILLSKDLHGLLLRLRIPLPSPATAFLMLLNYLLFTYLFEGVMINYANLEQGSINYKELFETGIKLVVLFFSFECFSRGTNWLRETTNVS